MTDKKTNLIWLDLEMTGLNPPRDKIIEIATIITDKNLNILATGPNLAIHQSNDLLLAMDDWNTKHHTQSGLVDMVRNSVVKEAEAEAMTLDFLYRYVEPQCSPLCGNSIWQDRRFLSLYMPKLEAFFHYRHLDVSTLKILALNWAPELLNKFKKDSNHRAQDDVRNSIEELKFYREHLLSLSK